MSVARQDTSRLSIAGQRVALAGEGWRLIVDPASEQVVGEDASGNSKDVNEAVASERSLSFVFVEVG